MGECVLPDNINDWNMRSGCIVQIGDPVGESRTKMNESARRFARHSRIAIRSRCDNPLEKAKHTTHFRLPIESGDKMHF
ncbi:MAG: hypothetical protein PVS2B2_18700 [Candidatus Acidiferrum sp.]